MGKLESFKEYYDGSVCDKETGEMIDIEKFIEIYEHCRESSIKTKRLNNFKKLKQNKGYKIKDDGRSWRMIYEEDIEKLNLTVEEEGVYSKLRKKLILDGSCRIYSGCTTIESYGKWLKISRNRIKYILESLKEKNIIYFETLKEILINQKYYRFGNNITNQDIVNIFNIDIEE